MRIFLKEPLEDGVRLIVLNGWHIMVSDSLGLPAHQVTGISLKVRLSPLDSTDTDFGKCLSKVLRSIPEKRCLFLGRNDSGGPAVLSEEDQGIAWVACIETDKDCIIWRGE